MKVQEWIFVLGEEEEIVMSCDLHISQSAHSLSPPLRVCMFDGSSYETVLGPKLLLAMGCVKLGN